MTAKTTRALGATLLALMLPLSACGSGDDEKAAQSISSTLRDNDSDLTLKKAEADCIGTGFVEEIGTEQLQEYKLLNADLEATDQGDVTMSQGDADKAATVFQDCVDLKAMLIKTFEDSGMPASATDCVSEELTEERMNAFAVGLFRNDESAGQDLATSIQGCVTGG